MSDTDIAIGIMGAGYVIIGGLAAFAAHNMYKPKWQWLAFTVVAWPVFLLTAAGVIKPFIAKEGESRLKVNAMGKRLYGNEANDGKPDRRNLAADATEGSGSQEKRREAV